MSPRSRNAHPLNSSLFAQRQWTESSGKRPHSSQETQPSFQSSANSSTVTASDTSIPASGSDLEQFEPQFHPQYPGGNLATLEAPLRSHHQPSLPSPHPDEAMAQVYSRQLLEPYTSTYYGGHYQQHHQDYDSSTFGPQGGYGRQRHAPLHDQSQYGHVHAGGSHVDESSYTLTQPQEPSHYPEQPNLAPAHSFEMRVLPLPVQPQGHQAHPTTHNPYARSPYNSDNMRFDFRQHTVPSGFLQHVPPIRQQRRSQSREHIAPQFPNESCSPPHSYDGFQTSTTTPRSTHSASPTVTRRKSSKRSKDPQLRRTASVPQHVCEEPDCSLTDRVFSTNGNLQRHRREQHGVGSVYSCPTPGCGTTFTRPTAKEKHLKHGRCKTPSRRRTEASAGPSRGGFGL